MGYKGSDQGSGKNRGGDNNEREGHERRKWGEQAKIAVRMAEKLIRNHPINYLPKTNGNTPKCVNSHIFIIIHIYGVHETLSSGLTTVSPRAK